MTVESNHAIALVLLSFAFLIGSKKLWVITQPIRNKLGIGIGLTSKSNCLVKPMVVLDWVMSRHLVYVFHDIKSGMPFAYFYLFFIKNWLRDVQILVSPDIFGLTLAKTIRLWHRWHGKATNKAECTNEELPFHRRNDTKLSPLSFVLVLTVLLRRRTCAPMMWRRKLWTNFWWTVYLSQEIGDHRPRWCNLGKWLILKRLSRTIHLFTWAKFKLLFETT